MANDRFVEESRERLPIDATFVAANYLSRIEQKKYVGIAYSGIRQSLK